MFGLAHCCSDLWPKRREICLRHVLWGRWTKVSIRRGHSLLFFFSWTWMRSLTIHLQEKLATFDKDAEVRWWPWSLTAANSLYQRFFTTIDVVFVYNSSEKPRWDGYNNVCMYQYRIQEKLPTYTLLIQPKPIFQLTVSVIIVDLVTVWKPSWRVGNRVRNYSFCMTI